MTLRLILKLKHFIKQFLHERSPDFLYYFLPLDQAAEAIESLRRVCFAAFFGNRILKF